MKICIVGGVAGGASAATRLRRMDEQAEIILFEKGEHISYANCGLPYYIGGVIKEESSLLVAKPELLINRFKIDVRVKSEVTSIDRANKKITVVDTAAGKTYEETYDKLVLSPGASPKKLGIKGEDLDGIFSVRTVENTIDIDNYIKANNVKTAIVAGGGFIGVEMAENLIERGLDVTLVEYAPQIMASLDMEMANILHREMIENGVKLIFNHGVKEYNSNNGKIDVMLDDGNIVTGDIVISALGVTPNSELAKNAGLELSVGNSIKTDDTFRTSDKDIYAVGDAIDVVSEISGVTTLIPLAGPANRQGRSAADNICGVTANNGKLVSGSSVAKVFDYTAASTGLNEKQLKKLNIEYIKTYIHPQSHAGYYPGAKQLSMKMLFNKEGKILGAQAIGIENVEKQIDVIAAVIKLKGTVYDLEEMELCYAPPFSSAKSPVNMLGFTAGNILRGLMPVFYAEDIENVDKSDKIFLDVSNPQEVLMGTIPNSINIPLNELRENLDKLDKNKKIYVNCRVGLRGNIATRILLQNGFDTYNLSGGYKTYSLVNLDLTKIKPRQPKKIKPKKLEKYTTDIKEIKVDACGLQCPGPIMKVAENIKKLNQGDILKISATDPAFSSDIDVWCERTGNTLVNVNSNKGTYEVTIEKGKMSDKTDMSCDISKSQVNVPVQNDKTMVVFSGDLDKAIASFIIANGAAAMDRNVTMFFTFWGLNILRKNNKVKVKKNFIEKMFGTMMPRGSKKLGLSKMNMGGMGAKMIRGIMKKKNVSSLEDLIKAAIDSGIRIVACQMSMDVMGIKKEELIKGVEIGGVATFLGAAELSDTNLFI